MRWIPASSVLSTSLLLVTVLGGRSWFAPTDACSLLSSAQINGAMGVSMGPGKAMASRACQWRQPVKQGAPGAIVDVTILDARRFDLGKAIAGSPKFKVTPVGGLGDDAYYSASSDGKITDLRVKKGDAAFAVHVWGAGVPAAQTEPEELALAKLIVTKF
jgi:hypothetical protein